MSQNVITTEEANYKPVLTLVTTEARYQAKPDKALIEQIDSKTILIDFQKPVVSSQSASRRTRDRFLGKVYNVAVIALISSSAVAAGYSLLTLQQ